MVVEPEPASAVRGGPGEGLRADVWLCFHSGRREGKPPGWDPVLKDPQI